MKRIRQWSGYEKGVNLGGWFSQCEHTREHYEQFITESDFLRLSGWDIDHVRIPIDYNVVQNTDGSFIEEGFALLERAVFWCQKYRLNLVLDLHKTAGYSFDSGENEAGFFFDESDQEKFFCLWEELARRFRGDEESIAFELLNEVVEKDVCEVWNRIADTCIRRIRKIAPRIKILVGGYWNNNVAAVADLAAPQDENIVYNFHCYAPLIFTHQGAWWTEGMTAEYRYDFFHTVKEFFQETERVLPNERMTFEGLEDCAEPIGSQYFLKLLEKPVRAAQEQNALLYCGEYGVMNTADTASTLRWYQAIHAAFCHYGINRAAWTYKGLYYGLTDPHMEKILPEILF